MHPLPPIRCLFVGDITSEKELTGVALDAQSKDKLR